jgi:hypothetical protein
MEIKKYEYMGIFWTVESDRKVNELMVPLLHDYYTINDHPDKPGVFSVRMVAGEFADLKEILEFGYRLIIHNSKKPAVHEEGLSFDNGFLRNIYNLTTKSVYSLNYLSHTVSIYNKDLSMLSRDGIRVIRDLVKACVEDQNGAVMYHAAALKAVPERGILLLGGKGSGKTTFSLKLIYKHGFTEVSRDRVFVQKIEESYNLYGWPNYYNLTMRTLKSFDKTGQYLPQKFINWEETELDKLSDKLQLLPADLGITRKTNRCKLTHIIFLSNKNKKNYQKSWDLLAESCYSPKDLNYPDWHFWSLEKRNTYNNARKISEALLNFQNTLFLEWTDIDEGVAKIRKFVE